MNIPKFPYSVDEIKSSIKTKAKAVKWILDLAYFRQPKSYLHKVRVSCPNGILQDNDCNHDEGIVAIYETEILYYYHPYQQSCAPRGLQRFALKQIDGVLNLPEFTSHLLSEHLVERYSNEINIDQKVKKLIEKHNLLVLEQKKAAKQDIKNLLEPIPEYFKFAIQIWDKNTSQLAQFSNQKLLDDVNIKGSEIRDYIEAIDQDNQRNIRSLSSSFMFRLALSASNIRRKEGLPPSLIPSYNNQKLLTCVEKIQPFAKKYYQMVLDEISSSPEIRRVGIAIFEGN